MDGPSFLPDIVFLLKSLTSLYVCIHLLKNKLGLHSVPVSRKGRCGGPACQLQHAGLRGLGWVLSVAVCVCLQLSVAVGGCRPRTQRTV